jgi:predicted XRE-type DNA-binding protein
VTPGDVSEAAVLDLVRAVQAVLGTPELRAFLVQHNPEALAQAVRAAARVLGAPSAGPASTLDQVLAVRVRELLVRERWSQRDLATRLGVTQSAVSYFLAGKRRVGVLDFYTRLAQVFGVSLSAFIADLEHRTR